MEEEDAKASHLRFPRSVIDKNHRRKPMFASSNFPLRAFAQRSLSSISSLVRGRARTPLLMGGAVLGQMLVAGHALAAFELPTVPDPVGVADGDWPNLMLWVVGVAATLIGVAIGAGAMFTVGGGIMRKLKDYYNDRIDLGEVIAPAAMGLGILILIIGLITAGIAVVPVDF